MPWTPTPSAQRSSPPPPGSQERNSRAEQLMRPGLRARPLRVPQALEPPLDPFVVTHLEHSLEIAGNRLVVAALLGDERQSQERGRGVWVPAQCPLVGILGESQLSVRPRLAREQD